MWETMNNVLAPGIMVSLSHQIYKSSPHSSAFIRLTFVNHIRKCLISSSVLPGLHCWGGRGALVWNSAADDWRTAKLFKLRTIGVRWQLVFIWLENKELRKDNRCQRARHRKKHMLSVDSHRKMIGIVFSRAFTEKGHSGFVVCRRSVRMSASLDFYRQPLNVITWRSPHGFYVFALVVLFCELCIRCVYRVSWQFGIARFSRWEISRNIVVLFFRFL